MKNLCYTGAILNPSAMDSVTLNYAAILVCALINMVLGALWYSPVLFGKIWMKGMKISPSDAKNAKYMGARYAVAFLMGLLMIFILAHYVDAFEATAASQGAEAAFWPWLGFMIPVFAGDVLWGGRSFSVVLINASYYFVVLMIAGVVLSVWQ